MESQRKEKDKIKILSGVFENQTTGAPISFIIENKDQKSNDYKKLKNIGKWIDIEIPDCKWKICVDTSPLLEKAWAEESGIGWIGKNSNLINKKNYF